MVKVLLTSAGLFSSTGGGQRFYEGKVLKSPEIHFFCFSDGGTQSDSARSTLPRNLSFVPMFDANRKSVSRSALSELLLDGRQRLAGKEYDIAFLTDIAASFAGIEFDIDDIPDYLPFGALLPAALSAFDVRVGELALSIHGTLSQGLKDNWDKNSLDVEVLNWFQDLLVRSGNTRYGISGIYPRAGELGPAFVAIIFDPSVEVSPPIDRARKSAEPTFAAPERCSVGRREKWKGPGLRTPTKSGSMEDRCSFDLGAPLSSKPSALFVGSASVPNWQVSATPTCSLSSTAETSAGCPSGSLPRWMAWSPSCPVVGSPSSRCQFPVTAAAGLVVSNSSPSGYAASHIPGLPQGTWHRTVFPEWENTARLGLAATRSWAQVPHRFGTGCRGGAMADDVQVRGCIWIAKVWSKWVEGAGIGAVPTLRSRPFDGSERLLGPQQQPSWFLATQNGPHAT